MGKEASSDPGAFRQTRWSLVARASSGDDFINGEARAAMEEICRDYWYPIYAFARRSGAAPADAEDLVQGFFLHVIDENALATADPARGKLRTFLIKIFRNHMTDELRRKSAQKRGGGRQIVSLDGAWAEERLAVELPLSDEQAAEPERAHDRRWAMLILERALRWLQDERGEAGRGGEMAALSPFLSFESGGQGSYESAAGELGWTVNATRVAVFRLRRRFRELLMRLVADTLENPSTEAVEAEMRELMAALE